MSLKPKNGDTFSLHVATVYMFFAPVEPTHTRLIRPHRTPSCCSAGTTTNSSLTP